MTTAASAADRAGGRAVRPGLGRAATLVLLSVLALLVAACGSQPHHSGLVGYPSYLPKNTLHVRSDAVLTGTAARPALTNQGDPVKVVTPHWSVLAVVSGPEVPGEGLPYQTPATTCTWTVSLSGATAPVPISVADFASIDNSRERLSPLPGAGPTGPAECSCIPGQRVSFELRAGEAVGEGLMRWAPIGGQIVAKWDFVVEND